MKRCIKIISMCLVFIVLLSLSGCSDKDDNNINEKEQSIEQNMMNFAHNLEQYRNLSDQEIQEYIDSIEEYKKNNRITEDKAKMNEDVIKTWHEIEKEIGTFMDYGEFEFGSAGKTYTATLTLKYTNRDVQLIYVISKDDFEITGANIEIIYSLGEKMSKAGLNTLMGIGIVFIMLILMSIIIYAFNIISYLQNKNNKRKEDKKIAITDFEDNDLKPTESQQDDDKLIAVIAAAIAAHTGASTDDFIVRSIRRRL